jgi:transposase
MRKPSSIELTNQQRSVLLMWVTAGKSEHRLAKKARVILCAAAGVGLKDMETEAGLSWQSCLKWRKRFVEHGLKGLRDIPGRGGPAVISPEERVNVRNATPGRLSLLGSKKGNSR